MGVGGRVNGCEQALVLHRDAWLVVLQQIEHCFITSAQDRIPLVEVRLGVDYRDPIIDSLDRKSCEAPRKDARNDKHAGGILLQISS